MEQHYVTDYMKDKEKEHLYKALVGVLIGFMLMLIAIFTVVAFHLFFIALGLAISGIICFIVEIYTVKRIILGR